MHDDAVEQGAADEHAAADLRDRLGDLDDLELVVAVEGVLEEMKKEKKRKEQGGRLSKERDFKMERKRKRKGGGEG